MNVLYLTETKSLRVLPLETVLDEMLNDGATPGNLKYLAQNLDAQGFDIGKIDGVSYAVIQLELKDFTISIQTKDKPAYKGAKDYSHI